MIYDCSLTNEMLYKEITMPKISPKILPEIIHFGRGIDAKTCRQIVLLNGYYTSLIFPQEAVNSTERQAQRMNYEYCVQTMAGLMKKYASEILN